MPLVYPAPRIPSPAAGIVLALGIGLAASIGLATSIAPAPILAPGIVLATSAGPGPSIALGYSRPIVYISAEELYNLLTYLYIITTIPKL